MLYSSNTYPHGWAFGAKKKKSDADHDLYEWIFLVIKMYKDTKKRKKKKIKDQKLSQLKWVGEPLAGVLDVDNYAC